MNKFFAKKRADCPVCGKEVTLTADGRLWGHNRSPGHKCDVGSWQWPRVAYVIHTMLHKGGEQK